ncbi:beta-fructofuranosidase, cell wall isozyme-like [Lotus japonicus]|uniref:beta-fructofuranosidase, cell wall isozyme-like n=1 Tax=Lotus japonicus TaxID=34305 RepID=UPI00258E0C02|nr:beta-fructofuranosidase, cell wall isozyme-like [Lotus japonicus]
MGTSSIWLLATFAFLLGYGVADNIKASHQTNHSIFILNQTYRPSFHFQPSKNWMNDPNGPMIYKGLYHMFYQHNPKAAIWSNNSIVWGHSVSLDLINWFPLQPALTPTQPYDINGCWSGSTTLLHGAKPVILYTGNNYNEDQTQNLAIPKNVSDPFLREWVKSPKNPVMRPTRGNKINGTSFRDPTTAWLGHDGFWRVIVGSQIGNNGIALLYLSKDFVNWVEAKHALHSAKKTGMWECPDFYPVLVHGSDGLDTSAINGPGHHVRHVLKAIPRTLWLHKSGKQLVQWPIVEIEKLRTNPVNLHSKVLKGGTLLEVSGVTAAQADVEISFEVSELGKAQALDPNLKLYPQHLCSGKGPKEVKGGLGPFGLLVLASKGMQEYTSVFFKVYRVNKSYVVLMCSDQSRSSLDHKNDLTTYGAFVDVDPVHEELSIRTLIDHSVVESFGGHGKACITARVYPTLAIDGKAHLHAFNNGTVDVKITRLSAWSMKKAKKMN